MAFWLALGFFLPPWLPRVLNNQDYAYDACKLIAEAQDKYHEVDWDGDGIFEYADSLDKLAQRGLISHELAAAEGLPNEVKPHKGYVFKILKAQGPSMPGGRKSYYIENPANHNLHFLGGVAVLAFPAFYGQSGKDSFLLYGWNPYFRDLGAETQMYFENATEVEINGEWCICYYGA